MIQAKPSIVAMAPYQNGSHCAELIENHKKILKLDSNESTIAPSPAVVTAIMRYLEEGPVNWYPDVNSQRLTEALVEYTEISADAILTFNGSDHALETIARTYLSQGSHVMQLSPTYDHFRVYVESCCSQIDLLRELPEEALFNQVENLLRDNTRIIYIVNPNNPTGFHTPRSVIERLLRTYPQILILVDEAYFEFSGFTVASLVQKYNNLIVTRSFSKAFGLAGLRCGYLLAHPDRCAEISKIRVGKNINAIAQIAATAALRDLAHMHRYVDDVLSVKLRLLDQMRSLGLDCRNTPANYILVKVHQPKAVVAFLKEHHIYIRDRSEISGVEGCVRITIGDSLAMKRFWKVFEQMPLSILKAGSNSHPVSAVISSS